MTDTQDVKYVRSLLKNFILSLMDDSIGPADIIEGIEKEVTRFESLVFDYE